MYKISISYLSMNIQDLTLDKYFYMISGKMDTSSPIPRVSEIAGFLELARGQHFVFIFDAFSFRSIRQFFFVELSTDLCAPRSVTD